MINNKKLGNRFEQELCDLLEEQNFWVYNCPSKLAGQPTDIICVGKNGKAVLIDAKVNSGKGFSFSRIESNQETSMQYFKKITGRVCWFAFKLPDNSIYFMSLDGLLTWWELEGKSSIPNETIKRCGKSLDEWVRKFA